MTHAGTSRFFKTLKENLLTSAFNLGGLLAGFIVAYQIGVFQLVPWVIALYPAMIGTKGILEGLLSGRLITALHLGTIHPRFMGNTKDFYKLINAVIVLTSVASLAISIISLVFGRLFWGIAFNDFPALFGVVVATMTLGLTILIITVKVTFVSFKRGLDPDILLYPVVSVVATIFITVYYFVILNLLMDNVGVWAIIFLSAANFILVIYLLSRNLHEPEFIKTIRDSLAALLIVAIIVNITGTLLKGIDDYLMRSRIWSYNAVYILYPALIGLIIDVGSVVGSTATTKLALGVLKPKLSALSNHAKDILTSWFASFVLFAILAMIVSFIHGVLTPVAFYNSLEVLFVTNVVAVSVTVILSFALSIVTFQKGLDPDNFVMPIEAAFVASITSAALFAALILLPYW